MAGRMLVMGRGASRKAAFGTRLADSVPIGRRDGAFRDEMQDEHDKEVFLGFFTFLHGHHHEIIYRIE